MDASGNLLGLSIDDLLDPLTDELVPLLLTPIKGAIGPILTATTDQLSEALKGIANPLFDGLSPLLEGLNQVVDLTINEQPTEKSQESEVTGTNGPGFTVNAVSLELLPNQDGGALVDVNLASSSVRATADAPDPGDEDANTNAAASAAASATADDDGNEAAQAASKAAAMADATMTASAASNADANCCSRERCN